MNNFLKLSVLTSMLLFCLSGYTQTSSELPRVELLSPLDTIIHYPDGKMCTAPANVCGQINILFTASNSNWGYLMLQGEFGNAYPQEELMYFNGNGSFARPFDSTLYPEGYYSIYVYGRNDFGTSDSVAVKGSSVIYISRNCVAPPLVGAPVPVTPIQDSIAPQISVISPANGANISAKAKNISIQVNAVDNVAVARVDCFIDGNLVGSSTSAPFTVKVSSRKVSLGSHSLSCKAVDAAGNVGESQLVQFSRN